MVNLKNITDLPMAESADGLNLLVNDNGSAKQIAAGAVGAQADWNVTDDAHPAFIKNKPEVTQADWSETDESSPAFVRNKPSKELMYEWNFEASANPDDCVWQIIENVDEDLSWLTKKTDSVGWEIEVTQYGCYADDDNGNDIVETNVYTTMTLNENCYGVSIQEEKRMAASMLSYGPEDLNNWLEHYYENYVCLYVYNKIHYDHYLNAIIVSNGGSIVLSVDSGGPFKSIKIYKTHY